MSVIQPPPAQLSKGLRGRHVHLIAIGGTIGVGLFLGSAKAIQTAGPGLIFVYAVAGTAMFFIVRALGELLMYRAAPGTFADYAAEFIGPFAGFSTAWTYWLNWVVVGMAELTAIGMYVQYWLPEVPQWLTALLVLSLLYGSNRLAVRVFGELEFWFAMIKVAMILLFIGSGVVVLCFNVGDLGATASIANLWSDGGVLPFGVLGLLLTLQIVMFAYSGIEVVAVTANEVENPAQTLPRAINGVIVRILLFYIGALVVVMALIPWRELSPTVSPFVLAFGKMGIPGAGHLVNFVVITAAASACNTGLYSTARSLFGVARCGQGPAWFGRLDARDVPSNAINFSAAVMLVGVVLNAIAPGQVFTWVTSIALTAALWTWVMILLSHARYRRAVLKGAVRESGYRMPGGTWVDWLVIAFLLCVTGLLALDASTRVALYVAPLWFAILAIAYRRRTGRDARASETLACGSAVER